MKGKEDSITIVKIISKGAPRCDCNLMEPICKDFVNYEGTLAIRTPVEPRFYDFVTGYDAAIPTAFCDSTSFICDVMATQRIQYDGCFERRAVLMAEDWGSPSRLSVSTSARHVSSRQQTHLGSKYMAESSLGADSELRTAPETLVGDAFTAEPCEISRK